MRTKAFVPIIFDEWDAPKNILVILAHPDDPEFFIGGTIAHWTRAGHQVSYLLLTKGERGVSREFPDGEALKALRVQEQANAARTLDVTHVAYMDLQDGSLEVNLKNRRKLVAEIRKRQPDIVVTFDPQMLIYDDFNYLNHPDHRAAGQLAVDAVFPAAGSFAFYPEQLAEGLKVTRIEELWLCLTNEANVVLDVSPYWETRLEALKQHVSQIGDPEEFVRKWNERRKEITGTDDSYYEQFRRVILRGL